MKNFFICPYCGNEAISLWGLTTHPLFFWVKKHCKTCHKEIKINPNTSQIYLILFCGGLFVSMILSRIFPDYERVFDWLFLGIFFVPILFFL
jgi:predicted RNA-binding Zn-ribbon protein involved in translation (DUF1610 family)